MIKIYNRPLLRKYLGGRTISVDAIIAIIKCIASILDLDEKDILVSFSNKLILEGHGEEACCGRCICIPNKNRKTYKRFHIKIYLKGLKKTQNGNDSNDKKLIKLLLHELKHAEDADHDGTTPEMYANAMEREMIGAFSKIYKWYTNYNDSEDD